MIDHTPYIDTVVDALRNAGDPVPDTWYTQVDDDLREAGIPLSEEEDAGQLLWIETDGWRLLDDGELYDLGVPTVAAPAEVVTRLNEPDRHRHLGLVGTPPSRWDDDELEENARSVDKDLSAYTA